MKSRIKLNFTFQYHFNLQKKHALTKINYFKLIFINDMVLLYVVASHRSQERFTTILGEGTTTPKEKAPSMKRPPMLLLFLFKGKSK